MNKFRDTRSASTLTLLLAAVVHLSIGQSTPEQLPMFLAPLENHTVSQGRDVFFTCVVNHLQTYKVAWIKSDSRAILAIQNHMVTHNPRLSITHNGHNTWRLHISNVQQNDSGTYMCQINTDPMRSIMGHMVVQIPPDIMDEESTDGLVTRERGNIKLRCIATGIPQPTVTWRREDGRNITLREEGREKREKCVKSYDGETLNLTGVLRQDMGTYLCIASNGVPPTISKRYSVQVQFTPVIKVTSQLVAAPVNRNVTLQCSVEASPRAMNTWFRDQGEKLLHSPKYTMTEYQVNEYSWQMNLTIHNLEKKDFGSYSCSAVNALGKHEASVRLQELELALETTPGSITHQTDPKIRKKQPPKKKPHRKSYDDIDDTQNYLNAMDEFGTTQMMGSGSTQHQQEGRRTERPIVFSERPWIVMASATQAVCPTRGIFLLLFATLYRQKYFI